MEYNEQTAKEIVEKYNLDKKTIKVWKTRNSIPDRYFKEGFEMKKVADSNADKVMIQRILDVLGLEELNTSTILELSKIKIHTHQDVKGGRSNFSETDVFNLKKEIKRLKIDIIKTFEFKRIKLAENLLKDTRIKKYVVIKKLMTSENMDMIMRRGIISDYEYEKIKESFMIFALRLNIN